MTLIEEEPLKKKIEAGPLTLKDALETAIQTAKGLQAAHAKGIAHRDIKPGSSWFGAVAPARGWRRSVSPRTALLMHPFHLTNSMWLCGVRKAASSIFGFTISREETKRVSHSVRVSIFI